MTTSEASTSPISLIYELEERYLFLHFRVLRCVKPTLSSALSEHWEAHENLNLIWLFPGHLLAGLWLLTDPDSPSPILRCYLTIACFGSALFGVVAHLLPKLRPAIYPLIAHVVWRCALERERRSVALN